MALVIGLSGCIPRCIPLSAVLGNDPSLELPQDAFDLQTKVDSLRLIVPAGTIYNDILESPEFGLTHASDSVTRSSHRVLIAPNTHSPVPHHPHLMTVKTTVT